MKPKTDAQVFRDAAQFCERGGNERGGNVQPGHYDGACDVLWSGSYASNRSDLRLKFYKMFVCDENGRSAFFLAPDLFHEEYPDDELAREAAGQEWRILALCFAAAMAETGDL